MTVSARAFWLLRGRLGRVSALGRSAVSLLAAPGTAGRALRGFRSSGLRYGALPDARPPRVRALPGAKPLAVGGAAAAGAGEALTREAGGSGQPCGGAGG